MHSASLAPKLGVSFEASTPKMAVMSSLNLTPKLGAIIAREIIFVLQHSRSLCFDFVFLLLFIFCFFTTYLYS